MKHAVLMKRWPVLAIVLLYPASSGLAVKRLLGRVGVVAVQDHANAPLDQHSLNGRLAKLLKDNSFDAVQLSFKPAADLEYEAGQVQCTHILYTDIVSIRRAGGAQLVEGMKSFASNIRPLDIWEAEVEFRLFKVNEVLPLLSTTVTGRNARSKATAATAPPAVEFEPLASAQPGTPQMLSVGDVFTEVTPTEDSGRIRKHKNVAVAAALERVVKGVRERLQQQSPP